MTRLYVVQVGGVARESYHVEADSEAEARARFERGEVTRPFASEVTDVEVEAVTLAEEPSW